MDKENTKLALDWSAYQDAGMGDAYADIPKYGGDYAKAIAVCINSGQCETLNKQVMCPSYKVSEESELSTGGRVRLLKSALSRDDWEEALADPALARAIDLCVSCKGCKRECDSNVDMALIKAEYMAWRRRHKGLTLRSRLFAHTPYWLYRFRGLRHFIVWRNRFPLLRRLSERLLQLSAVMPLPEPTAKPFQGIAQPVLETVAVDAEHKPQVLLLVDTFTRYFEPEIAHAAEQVLRAGGYFVTLAVPTESDAEPQRPLCCGRTYLAQGMVEEARLEVQRMVTAITPHIAAGKVVVGLEASCVLGLRDDALALGLGEPLRNLSKQVFLFEEFLAKESMAKRLALPLQPLPAEETLVHGHCHQKAVGAMKSVRKILKLIPDHNFSMIESGCCGMAGTFSLEAEHQAMGSAMAAQALLPNLKAKPNARVIANGFSCRQQMRAHGDDRAQHLAILMRDALLDD